MRPALVVALVALGCGDPVTVEAPDAHVEPAFAALEAEECGACHAEHLADFMASRHHAAFTGELFRAEWGIDHDPFCLPCHAPRVREDAWLEPARAAAGVDCASCHLVDGAVRAVEVSGQAPHASVADPSFGTAAACAPCHQIDFPTQDGLPLQNTVAEFHAAGEPAGACQTCHMAAEAGRHRHDWVGGHDPAFVATALRVEAERRGRRVVIRLHNEGAGHAIPTGDVFRRLVVGVGRERVELGRHLVHRDGAWHPVRDDRVPAGGVRELSFDAPGPVEWSVELASQPRFGDDALTARDAPRLVHRGRIAAR